MNSGDSKEFHVVWEKFPELQEICLEISMHFKVFNGKPGAFRTFTRLQESLSKVQMGLRQAEGISRVSRGFYKIFPNS